MALFDIRPTSGGGHAGVEAVFQLLAVEIAADEDKAAFALFAFFPGALVITFDDHVNTLNDIAFRIVLERDDALEAQDLRTIGLRNLLDPREETIGVHFAAAQRNGLDGDIMDG